jgi:riboflavin kinase
MKFQSEEIVHLPDLLFSKLCEDRYKINKGVYNTIDRWFYEQGVNNLVNRRQMILSFCQSFCIAGKEKVKFGPGGLTTKLNLFWTQRVGRFNQQAI